MMRTKIIDIIRIGITYSVKLYPAVAPSPS